MAELILLAWSRNVRESGLERRSDADGSGYVSSSVATSTVGGWKEGAKVSVNVWAWR